jgi:hypothetical protein
MKRNSFKISSGLCPVFNLSYLNGCLDRVLKSPPT